MKDYKFLEFWNNTIKPIIDKLSEDHAEYGATAVKESDVKKDMESLYDNLRKKVKEEFMKRSDCRLDRHKVCACIYTAISENPIFKVVHGSQEKDRLVNVQIAFISACNVLYSFVLDDAKDDLDFENFLKTRGMLCFPEKRGEDSGDSYFVQTIKSLCYEQKNRNLSVLAFANIFFQLENNTRHCYRLHQIKTTT